MSILYDDDYCIGYRSDKGSVYSQYGSETETMSEDTTVHSKNNNKLSKISYKTVDKGLNKMKIYVNGKIVKVRFFETKYLPGTLIRNAITGNRFEGLYVGKKTEDLFFKVCNTTIENGTRTPIIMYFDSPEQFEKHFKCTVTDANKERWRNKNNIIMKLRNEQNDQKYHMQELNSELLNTIVK